jgi:hypothetical protein
MLLDNLSLIENDIYHLIYNDDGNLQPDDIVLGLYKIYSNSSLNITVISIIDSIKNLVESNVITIDDTGYLYITIN